MARSPLPRRTSANLLVLVIAVAAVVLLFAPSLVGGWLGGVVGEVWATALLALTALFGGLFGAP